VRLTVVGCSGSFPQPDAAASCYLVEADDDDGRTWRVLLDLGSGALGPLQRHADLHALDAVCRTCTRTTASTSPACTWRGGTTRPGPHRTGCPCTARPAPCSG
jgi:hypothetical protein